LKTLYRANSETLFADCPEREGKRSSRDGKETDSRNPVFSTGYGCPITDFGHDRSDSGGPFAAKYVALLNCFSEVVLTKVTTNNLTLTGINDYYIKLG